MTNTPVLSCVETVRPDIQMQRKIANEIVPKVIHEVASEFSLDLLDIYSLFGGGNNTKYAQNPEVYCEKKPEFDYVDGYHYNIHQIAEFVWLYLERKIDFDQSIGQQKLIEWDN